MGKQSYYDKKQIVEESEPIEQTGTVNKKIKLRKNTKKYTKTGVLDKSKFSIFVEVQIDKKTIESNVAEEDGSIAVNLKDWDKEADLRKLTYVSKKLTNSILILVTDFRNKKTKKLNLKVSMVINT